MRGGWWATWALFDLGRHLQTPAVHYKRLYFIFAYMWVAGWCWQCNSLCWDSVTVRAANSGQHSPALMCFLVAGLPVQLLFGWGARAYTGWLVKSSNSWCSPATKGPKEEPPPKTRHAHPKLEVYNALWHAYPCLLPCVQVHGHQSAPCRPAALCCRLLQRCEANHLHRGCAACCCPGALHGSAADYGTS